jgi:hypothetical protein
MFTKLSVRTIVFLASCAPMLVWAQGGVTGNVVPSTYGYVEGLFMDRDNDAIDRPLVLDLNTNEVLLTTGDLDFDWTGGVRGLIGQALNNCWAVEFGYLGIFENNADATVSRDDSLRLPGDLGSGQVNNFFFADEVNVDWDSSLCSVEANLVGLGCRCDCCSHCMSGELLFGFRYFNLDEDFALTAFDSAEGTTTYGVHTDNDLYGVQLGGRLRYFFDVWSFEATGKGGVYANDVRQNQDPIIDFPNPPGVVVRPALSSSEVTHTFVSEVNLTAIYHLNSVWGVRAGYNFLYLDGVALAPDQLDFTNTPNSGLGLFNQADVFYHGASFGLEARY